VARVEDVQINTTCVWLAISAVMCPLVSVQHVL